MVVRWRGILGRVDDGVAPVQGYRDFLSWFGIPVSEFQLTYWRDELIDQVSVWGGKGRSDCLDSLTATLYMAYNPIYHSLPHVVMRHQHDSAACPTDAAGLKFSIGKDITL
jgi:hypothetical protein